MKRACFGVLVLALFLPVGIRVMSWQGIVPMQLDAAEVDQLFRRLAFSGIPDSARF